MEVKCELVMDLDTGAYEIRLQNLSQPGAKMDYDKIQAFFKKVVADWSKEQLAAT